MALPHSTLTAPPVVRRAVAVPLVRHLLLAALGLVVMVIVIETVSDFRAAQLATVAYLGIAAGGLTLLTGTNGQISLGHGAFMAIGAYTTALMLSVDEPLPLVAALLAATLVALAVGAVVGVAAARLEGPYLAGATLALAVAVPGVALFFRDTLGGEQGLPVSVPDIPEWVLEVAFFVTGSELSRSRYVAYIGWLTLLVTYVLLANLMRSRVGRRWRAVRDDQVAAEIAGIDLGRARISAFMVSAAAAGAAGFVLALVVRIAAPSGFLLTLSLSLLTAVVLGGLGTLSGALLGAALLTFLPQFVSTIGRDLGLDDTRAAELAPLVYGLVMVLVVLLAPAGAVGSFLAWRARRRAGRATAPTTTDETDTGTTVTDPTGTEQSTDDHSETTPARGNRP